MKKLDDVSKPEAPVLPKKTITVPSGPAVDFSRDSPRVRGRLGPGGEAAFEARKFCSRCNSYGFRFKTVGPSSPGREVVYAVPCDGCNSKLNAYVTSGRSKKDIGTKKGKYASPLGPEEGWEK